MSQNKIVYYKDRVVTYDGKVILISEFIDYYITQNHSAVETQEHFSIKYPPYVILKHYNIRKPKQLSYQHNKKTLKLRYGRDNYNNPEKYRKTMKERYGIENIFQDVEYIKKCRKNKIGVEFPVQDKTISQKVVATCRKAYGLKYEIVNEKRYATNLARYGVRTPMECKEIAQKFSTPEHVDKIWKTKLEQGTTNTSKPENELYEWLCSVLGNEDVVREYVDKIRYPYHCDFYIKTLDMFVELNLFWTHGGHPYNCCDEEDVRSLEDMKLRSKSSTFYASAIYVWTVLDVEKLHCAVRNNLNYIALYNNDDILIFKENILNGSYNNRK